MRKASKATKVVLILMLVAVAIAGVSFYSWYSRALAPTEPSDPFFVRYESGTTFDSVLEDLVAKRVVRDKRAVKVFCYLNKVDRTVRVGTFEFRGGMTTRQILGALKRPIEQQVRIPEGWWITRVARRLEEKDVCTADEYIALANNPSLFAGDVSFRLPEKTLEGYLYPDTYDLPPLLGAAAVIKRQLRAFEEKVWKEIQKRQDKETVDINQLLTKASLVELEAGVEEDRPRIAGVIENRLAINQRLQIDATVLYALQEWRVLMPGEVNTIEHPYNTYKINGLPPGPIGSPAWRSISAVLAPEQHKFLYYVARPDLTHYFSATYDEHLRNIRKARAEFAKGQDT